MRVTPVTPVEPRACLAGVTNGCWHAVHRHNDSVWYYSPNERIETQIDNILAAPIIMSLLLRQLTHHSIFADVEISRADNFDSKGFFHVPQLDSV